MSNGRTTTFYNNPFSGFPNSATSFLPLEINRPGSDYREVLIKNVSENLHYIMFLTQEEAYAILKELAPVGKYDVSERNLDRLGLGATYAGNTKDGITTSKIIWKLKGLGVAAKIYRARNDEQTLGKR